MSSHNRSSKNNRGFLRHVSAKAPVDFGMTSESKTAKDFQYTPPSGYKSNRGMLSEEGGEKVHGDHVEELETRLTKMGTDATWGQIDEVMRAIAKKHVISPKKLHDDFKEKNDMIPDKWIVRNQKVSESVSVKKTPMEQMADRIAASSPKQNAEPMTEALMDNKVIQLEKQVYDMRKMILEVTQGQVASRQPGLMETMGGSGEVRFENLDDVDVKNVNDGDILVWDAVLYRWIPASALAGGSVNFTDITRQLNLLEQKIVSMDAKVENIVEGNELQLTLEGGTPGFTDNPEFIDDAHDGGTMTFSVDIDNRGVYTLDGVAQPSIQVYRGDLVSFDISTLSLAQAPHFKINVNGNIIGDNDPIVDYLPGLVTVNTVEIPTGIDKFYYVSETNPNAGWVIVLL